MSASRGSGLKSKVPSCLLWFRMPQSAHEGRSGRDTKRGGERAAVWGLPDRGGVAGDWRDGGRLARARKPWRVPAEAGWCQHWPPEVSSNPSPARVPGMPAPSSRQVFCTFASPILFVKVTMIFDARAPRTLPPTSLQQEEVWGRNRRETGFYKAACFLF